ncbi:MAG: EAL domain-containing protein [Eubacterium sp.]|nr:EAL domain-containing protein [Eubacterium sp.]
MPEKNLVPVSVNLSRHDLELPDLHEKINSMMDSFGLDHWLLRIEITESALINNEKIIQDHIRRFHQGGYQVWLDDFGSGYSSLNAVQNFDFDVLKIDMQFLRHQNAKTPAILTDIVDMAKRTGMLVLSEGVETMKQYDFLREIGCVLAQGFYFTKPLPLDQCLSVMKEKGYHHETRADHEFYERIGRINVLHPFYSVITGNEKDTGSPAPTAIHVVEGGKLTSIYMNQACQRWLNMAQLENVEKSNDDTNSRENSNSLRIWECLNRISDIGESAHADYVTPGFTWKMQYTMIAKDGPRKAYVTTSVNPEYAFMSTDSGGDVGDNPITKNNIWAAFMESESAFFYWKDSSRRFLGANRAFLNFYQIDLSNLIGKTFEEAIGGSMAADLAEKEQKILETGITIRDSISVTLAGGCEHQIMTSMAPIYHEGKIVGLTGQSMDITMVAEERKSLEQEILKDPLTGIPNRRGFNRFMDQLSSDAAIKEAYIVNADINKFKSFNDRYGHAVGDILLKSFAEEAVAFVGDKGTVSRNGGDEFQFFFPNPASGFSSRLQEFFNRDHEFRAGSILYRYSISGGVAIYPDMSRDVQELYDKADIALYHAKLDPHHNIALYNELMKEESREGMGLTFSDLAAGEPASVLIYRFDETEEILYANENCLKLFGCEDMREFMKLTGRSFRTLIHPDDRETTEKDISLQQANPDNDGYDFIIFRILTRDGKEKEIMDIGRKIHDPYYGDLFYVLLWDNKELLRMFRRPHYDTVQQLGGGSSDASYNDRHSDYDIGELTDFLQMLPGGMHRCYLSSPGHLEWCSPSLIRMLGYEEDEFHDLVGSIYVKIMAKEDWGSFVELGRRLSVKPGVGSCFYHLIKKDGTHIPCIEVMQSAMGPDGIMYGYANVMDISTILRDVPLSQVAK